MKSNKGFLIFASILVIILVVFALGRNSKQEISVGLQEGKLMEINYFWLTTCPYCQRMNLFWNDFLEKYPEVQLNKYLASDARNMPKLTELVEKYNAQEHAGVVPLTFVGDQYIVGFDGPEGTGKKVEDIVIAELEKIKSQLNSTSTNISTSSQSNI